jgi:hypothetical protein
MGSKKNLQILCCRVFDLVDLNDWGNEFFLDDLQVFLAFTLFSPWPCFLVVITFEDGTTSKLPSSKLDNISSK